MARCRDVSASIAYKTIGRCIARLGNSCWNEFDRSQTSNQGPTLLMKCWMRYPSLRDRFTLGMDPGAGRLAGEVPSVLPTGDSPGKAEHAASRWSSCRRVSSSMEAGDEKSGTARRKLFAGRRVVEDRMDGSRKALYTAPWSWSPVTSGMSICSTVAVP